MSTSRNMVNYGTNDMKLALLAAVAVSIQAQDGAKLFSTRCAGCHGSDGAGGEHAPSIVERFRRDLRTTIKDGIQSAGMPAFSFTDPEMTALIAYIGELRAPAADHPANGNVQAGRTFFLENCAKCHSLVGPDLSNIGRDRRLSQIERALHHPDALVLRLKDGHTLTGFAKNESNYDVQLQTIDGELHAFSKSQIAEQTRVALVPTVDATKIPDLLAFLSRLNGEPINTPPTTNTRFKPGDWPTYHGNFNGNRHSDLKQIDITNVAHLAPAFMFPIPKAQRLEGTPIVVDGIMYVTTANECFALDAKNGRQIWHYARPLTKGVIGDAESAINRGVAILGDKLFMITDHAHLLALNRLNGHLLWDTEMADFHQHYGATGAPLAIGNLVLSGTSGGDEGAPGFIAAYDAETGKQVWRFSTIEGPKTWIGRAIEHGCVDAWFTGTYDPSTDMIFWPTGNPCPDYNGDERQGDNLYANSVVALEPKTGKLRWYYQFTPHDVHDWDAVAPLLAIDAAFKGTPRKLLLQADRNGYFYVLDRTTGEFLLGEPFVKKTDWADGIDEKGRPRIRSSATPTPEGTKTCPNVVGATNWFSSTYNPSTGLFYVMALESCGIFTKSDAWWEQGKSFYGGGTRRVPGEKPERFLRALDIQTGRTVWEIPQIGGGGGWGGVLSTAGGLVFFCDEAGAFAAADAKSGKLLWHFYTNQPWHASPMTYEVDGKQFVAVASGSNFISFALP